MPFVLANIEGGRAISLAAKALTENQDILDALETAIREVEADPSARTVGYGGRPDLLGHVSFDAALIHGGSKRAGAVAGLRGFPSAITVARAILERLPHVLLAGDGAARFARELGLAPSPDLLHPASVTDYQEFLKSQHLSSPPGPADPLAGLAWASGGSLRPGDTGWTPPSPKGTTVFLASDGRDLAAATSTSGWPFRHPGRIGDSPVIGAGLYADSRFGACACTHTGEMTIRAATSSSVVHFLRRGASVREAVHEAAADLRGLSGGFLGPVVIHAASRSGDHHVLAVGLAEPFPYHWWDGDPDGPPRRLLCEVFPA